MIRIELHGLEVFGHHGVEEWERRDGQPFLFDVELEVGDGAAGDRLGDTIDYCLVAAAVKRVSDERPCNLLEALAARVRACKPQVQIPGFQVLYTAAAVERRR